MKGNPIVLVHEGCSMSTFTINTIINLLKLHKYDLDYPKGSSELYVPHINPFYKNGMNLIDMLKKTFEEMPNVVMKINMHTLRTDGVIKILENKKARLCFFERENLLDIAICSTKDFFKKSEKRKLFKKFDVWRNSDARAEEKVDSSDLISIMKFGETKRLKKMKIMQNMSKVCNNQKKFISSTKLCNLDVSEYAKVFKILGFDFKEELVTKYLSDLDVIQPYKHKDVIQQEDIDDFKSELKKHGLFKYWRD